MAWDTNLINLRDVLSGLYWDKNDARRVAQDAGLNVGLIGFSDKPVTTWHNILTNAMAGRNKVKALIDVAHKDYPDNDLLDLAEQDALNAVRGPDIANRVAWQGPDNPDQLEKIIGKQSTLLPISFLERGLINAQAVVRIVRADGEIGSGFLTDNRLIITNNHVLDNPDQAAQARVEFNYQKSLQDNDLPAVTFQLAPLEDKGFATSKEDDWTAVRLQGDPAAQFAKLTLAPAQPQKEDYAIIIQHPGGGPKQIALYHNVIAYADATRIQYLTDTLPGSSGSPVFDTDWHVIALHHSGGWLREPNSKQTYYRNEGIHINVVIEGLKQAGMLGV